MKSDLSADTPDNDGSLEETELEAVKEFLRGAPEGASQWATEQLKKIEADEGLRAESDAKPSYDLADDDPSDVDDDDVVSNRASAGVQGSSPVGGRYLVIAAIIVGVVFGVWFAGRDQGPEASAETPNLGTETTDDESFDRMVQLEYELNKDPDNIEAHLELGVLLFNRRDVDGAKEHWDAVLELDSENPNAWYNLGFLSLSATPPDMEAAKDAWEKVVEYAPESDMAQTAAMHLSGLSAPQSGDSEKQS